MKGLSLLQPWATLVAIGAKRIETRAWPTSYRGLVAIHASKEFKGDAQRLSMSPLFAKELRRAGIDWLGDLPLGAIIAVAEIVDCRRVFWPQDVPPEPERSFGDYSDSRYAWHLANIRALPEPVPCRGTRKLWTVPENVAGAVAAQLQHNGSGGRPD